MKYLNLKEIILAKIKENGGWVNCHAHLDRAYTLNPEKYKLMNKLREEKWALNRDIRRSSTVDQIYDRMAYATEMLMDQGCFVTGTFIDVDNDVRDKAIKAAMKVRDRYRKMTYKFMNQSSYGILNKIARDWFEVGADFVDIIGGLLKADMGHEEEHLDILLSAAKKRRKMVHIHVDENNIAEEKETEILIKKMIEHNMQGKVVGIHGISINAHPKAYRENLYKQIKKAGLMFVACPMSWINSRRNEKLTPTHNPVTPLDEMHPHGITVALGIDNLADIFMAYNDGNLWNDLRLLMECNRFYDIDEVVKIATSNGRKVLGLDQAVSFVSDKQNTHIPFYDHTISYIDNYDKGPFGLFATFPQKPHPKTKPVSFLGFNIDLPFGIPAGPLLNSKYVNAAWNWGYSIATYKTVRANEYPTHPAPNVIKVTSKQRDIHPGETVLGHPDAKDINVMRDGVTNSFGVPSKPPPIWQADVKKSLKFMKPGCLMVLSFMGTKKEHMTLDEYVKDFANACKLAKNTGAPVLEVNFSCPNVGKEGLICNDIPTSRAILEALKVAKGNTPLLVKIGYFDHSQDELLSELLDAIYENTEGVSGINTIQAKVIDVNGKQALPGSPVRIMSGICGTAIKWAGLEMAQKLVAYKKGKTLRDFVVLGVGGVTTVDDYKEYISLGVDAVQSATGAMWRQELAVEVRRSII